MAQQPPRGAPLSTESPEQDRPPEDACVDTPVDEEDIWRLATALSGAVEASDVALAPARRGAAARAPSFPNIAILETDTKQVRVVHGSVLNRRIAARWSEFHL